ncbi:hypothetical protein DIZ27_42710 [Streptomyces sp. NWU339]|nr:hypothetical protein DIZ27_42710 [Streptomyces sp. NWU339]
MPRQRATAAALILAATAATMSATATAAHADGHGHKLYCALVFDTYQVNAKVSRKNSCQVVKKPEMSTGPVYFDINSAAQHGLVSRD